MKKTPLYLLFCLGLQSAVWAQSGVQDVFTIDIDHFWQAYDSCQTTTDSLRQLKYIQTLYIDRGTPGLPAFMEKRDYSVDGWVALIRTYPKFWNSIRPHTLRIKTRIPVIESYIERLRVLYPSLKPARIYFTIGGLASGGTTKDSMVLMGAELAAGDPSVDISEFSDHWVGSVFKDQTSEHFIPLCVHEYIHTQQSFAGTDLLSQALVEGAADFMAELTMGAPIPTWYMKYGNDHEAEVKEEFKKEMFGNDASRWLYNGTNDQGRVGDLGYFMGYCICRSYYRQASDKQQAIKEIINLPYSDTVAVLRFLTASGYYEGPIDRQALLEGYKNTLPYITGIAPFSPGDTTVSAGLTELSILFSEPMDPRHLSIALGPGGKETYPFGKDWKYSDDKKSLLMKLDLKPGHNYDFVVNVGRFRSAKGFPLKAKYPVTFRTKSE